MSRLIGSSATLMLPYGTAAVSVSQASALRDGRGDDLNRPGAPVAQVERDGGALRIHQVVHRFTRPPVAQDLARGKRQADFLEAHLAGLCGARNRPLKALVHGYFNGVRARLAARSDELAARLGNLRGLAEPDHWLFSAPMPLPQAHVPLNGGFADADLAFWDGSELICCFVETGTIVGARRRSVAALSDAGARVEHIGRDQLENADALLSKLGAAFDDPTGCETLPRSPFRGRGILPPA